MTKIEAAEIVAIARALDILLIKLSAYRKARDRSRPPEPLKLVEWDAGDDPGPIPPREESAIRRIIEDPVEGAFLLAIDKLEERLLRTGGHRMMQLVAYRDQLNHDGDDIEECDCPNC